MSASTRTCQLSHKPGEGDTAKEDAFVRSPEALATELTTDKVEKHTLCAPSPRLRLEGQKLSQARVCFIPGSSAAPWFKGCLLAERGLLFSPRGGADGLVMAIHPRILRINQGLDISSFSPHLF